MRRLWRGPTSLPGQIALLVAIALFVAQAINFALLLRERRNARFQSATAPAIARLIDASMSNGRILLTGRDRGGRSRVTVLQANPLPPAAERVPAVEEAIRTGLTEAGIPARTIVTAVQRMDRNDPRIRRMEPFRAARYRRFGAELAIAVEQPGRGWMTLTVGWPQTERGVIAQLIAQTLILYGIVLLAVLWIGRRIASPLRHLAEAARHFRPGEEAEPLEERGPADVRAVIAAYNALGLRVTAMLDEKDRMLGAIGHDLRTPLAALRVRIESVEDESDRERMAEIIDEMNTTLDDILSLARLGRSSEPPVEVDLAALVDAVVDDFRDLGHDIAADEAPRLPIRLRPTPMRRAVRNLIENAIKYAGSAEVSIEQTTVGARINVKDRGPGIPDDQLEHVFDPFIRIESSRNRGTGGIGLGLALARAIVNQAGGHISLTNRQGGGLVATVELPRG